METKPGSLYELTSCDTRITHRILCADSTDPEAAEYLFEEQNPFLMVTDPPYGVSYDPSWRQKDLNDSKRVEGDIDGDDTFDWAQVWSTFPGNIAYIWHAAKHTCEVAQSLMLTDFEIINQIIWAKQHFAISRGNYHWQHEPCWYARRKGKPHNWQGSRNQSTLWTFPNMNAINGSKDEDCRTNHPTQKPLECMTRPIQNNTFLGQGVYDPFLGSGTTLIACEMLDRQCFGIEIDPDYCDIIIARWVNFMNLSKKKFIVKREKAILFSD